VELVPPLTVSVPLALAAEVERCALIRSPGMRPAATNGYTVAACPRRHPTTRLKEMSLNVSISFGHDTTTHTNPSIYQSCQHVKPVVTCGVLATLRAARDCVSDQRPRHILVKLTMQGRSSRRLPLPCVPSKLASMV
jgi:hypothetical protein